MSGYSPTGPFTAGSAPGVSALFLNQVESFIQTLEGDVGYVQVAGGTSGTAICYEVVQGTFKYAIIVFNNFRTAGSAQNLTLPTPFSSGFYLRSSQTPTLSFMNGGSAQSANIVTGLPGSASASGGVSSGTSIGGYNQGELRHPCDTVQFAASGSVAVNGYTIMEGS